MEGQLPQFFGWSGKVGPSRRRRHLETHMSRHPLTGTLCWGPVQGLSKAPKRILALRSLFVLFVMMATQLRPATSFVRFGVALGKIGSKDPEPGTLPTRSWFKGPREREGPRRVIQVAAIESLPGVPRALGKLFDVLIHM